METLATTDAYQKILWVKRRVRYEFMVCKQTETITNMTELRFFFCIQYKCNVRMATIIYYKYGPLFG